MSRPADLILGDSHVDALKEAVSEGGADLPTALPIRLGKMKNGKQFGDLPLGSVLERVRAVPSDGLVVCAVGGNQHQTMSLIEHARPFDLMLPGEDSPPAPGRELVPFQAMRATFETGLRNGDLKILEAVREAARCAVVQLAPPPPKADEAHLLRTIETYFAERGIREHGIAPAPVRLKVWRVQVLVLRALCAEIGVAVLPVPDAALTPEGFLDPAFYARDATHANAAYGALVLRQIAAIDAAVLAAGRAPPPPGTSP